VASKRHSAAPKSLEIDAIGGRDEQAISVFFKNVSQEANGESDARLQQTRLQER
jgi:hypothetical protein